MWLYESPIGNIYIVPLADGSYGMLYNGIIYEACDTPEDEADNIYMQVTGCYQWDMLDTTNVFVPHDLSEWIRR